MKGAYQIMDLRERRRERERRRRRRRRIAFLIFVLVIALITTLCLTMCDGGNEPAQAPVPTPEVTMSPEPTPTPSVIPTNPSEALTQMTLDEKLMQLFAVDIDTLTGVENTTLHGNTSQNAISKNSVGAIVYDIGNLENKNQAASMLNSLQAQYKEENGFKALLAIAEEGGENSPAASVGIGNNIGDLYAFAENDNFEGAYNAGLEMGKALSGAGFNMNLAPDCGVEAGEDAESVSSIAISFADGLRDGGVRAAYKSFPGTAAATALELSETALLPFKTAISAGAEIMTVRKTASRSSEMVTTVLRTELDFDGIIMTEAITAGMCVEAIAAGCDLLYVPTEYEDAMDKLRTAIATGALTEDRINESVLRILTYKYGI